MAELRVEICGLCCHYIPDGSGLGPIRTVLVDLDTDPQYPHYAHIEVQRGGVVDSAGLERLPALGEYVRDGVAYEAYRLAGHKITFDNIVDTGHPETQPAFDNCVPHLPDICGSFGTRILDFLVDDPVEPVAAHVDITTGALDAFQYSEETHFEPVFNDPPDEPGRDRALATGTFLTLTGQGNAVPTVNVTPFGGASSQFTLRAWVPKIRIANLGINAMKGLPELDAEHFLLYYEMADVGAGCGAKPVDPPTAGPKKGLGGGCTNNTYP